MLEHYDTRISTAISIVFVELLIVYLGNGPKYHVVDVSLYRELMRSSTLLLNAVSHLR